MKIFKYILCLKIQKCVNIRVRTNNISVLKKLERLLTWIHFKYQCNQTDNSSEIAYLLSIKICECYKNFDFPNKLWLSPIFYTFYVVLLYLYFQKCRFILFKMHIIYLTSVLPKIDIKTMFLELHQYLSNFFFVFCRFFVHVYENIIWIYNAKNI